MNCEPSPQPLTSSVWSKLAGLIAPDIEEEPETFRAFASRVNPRYQWYRHCEAIASVAERVASGELRRVMLFVPPRHSKSETISRLFSAYYLRRFPDRWVGLMSYSSELAYVLSRASQDNYLASGGALNAKAGAVKHWETGRGGGLWAAGVGGPITGKGFHCFPAGTMVETEQGPIAIEALCRLQDSPKVLSFNHERKTLEWRQIVAFASQPGRSLVEVALHSGRRVRCTSDHPIYCAERGYVAAGSLVPGETVTQVADVSELRDLRNGYGAERALPCVLSGNPADSIQNQVRALWHRVFEVAMRPAKVSGASLCRSLLRERLQPRASRHKEPAKMQGMRNAGGPRDLSLLRELPAVAIGRLAAIAGQVLQLLLQDVSTAKLPINLLWQGLSELRALAADAWRGQQSLQGWHELCGLVPQNAAGDIGAGWPRLHDVRGGKWPDDHWPEAEERHDSDSLAAGHTPHRSRAAKQSSREPDYALLGVSQATSPIDRCWQADAVSSVTILGDQPHVVYDIQVEGNSNFFANGILVHNCGIIDDPLKNAEEASSSIIREKHKEWYRSTFYTRAEPNASVLIIQTRWHGDDLSGWLLSEESGEASEGWHIVNLPAIAEDAHTFPVGCTVEPDWRATGEALCPERYDLARLRQIESRIGGYYFNALYQQRPSAKEGAFFKVHNLEIVDAAPANLRTCRAWDLAASTGAGDYTAGVKLGVDDAGIWYVLDVVRGQWGPDERDGHLRLTTSQDGKATRVRLAQDPGQAGVDQVQRLTRMLAGYSVRSERVSGAKEVRADGFASQVNAGNVRIVRGAWNAAFIEELRQFPFGKHDDQIDASADAFAELLNKQKIGVIKWD